MDSALFFLPLLLFPFFSALVCYLTGRFFRLAGAYAIFAALVQLGAMAAVGGFLWREGGTLELPGLLGLGLNFSMTGLQFLLCMLACLLWMGSTLAAREQLVAYGRVERYHLFSFLTLGGILGVFMSADLYTLLIFFEIMSFSSWPLVQHSGTKEARRAADSYLAFAVFGGLSTLMGLFLLYSLTGTLRFGELAGAAAPWQGSAALYTAGALTAAGFASKAAVWPLHTWLPTAHPAAPAPASALLSGIITKAGMYGLIFLAAGLFAADYGWGMATLLLGTVTMLTGAVLALFSVNLKRTLACSSMSQIGFILVGLGMQGLLGEENGIAVAGLTLHICNHALFKLCLFVSAGVVAAQIHHLKLDEIQGFGRGKPLLMFSFGMGALGLMGMPLFSGYISKTLLHESIVEYLHLLEHDGLPTGLFTVLEWLFLIAGGLTAAYMTRLFICLFVEKNADPTLQADFDSRNGRYMKPLTGAVLCLGGLTVAVLGMTPHLTMDRIAGLANGFFSSHGLAHAISYFSWVNLKGSLISLAIGGAVYLLIARPLLSRARPDGGRRYPDLWPTALDLEEKLYRPLLGCLAFWGAFAARLTASLFGWAGRLANGLIHWRQGETVRFPEDEFFAVYEAEPKGRFGFQGSVAFSLLLFCIGFAGVMFYMLLA